MSRHTITVSVPVTFIVNEGRVDSIGVDAYAVEEAIYDGDAIIENEKGRVEDDGEICSLARKFVTFAGGRFPQFDIVLD